MLPPNKLVGGPSHHVHLCRRNQSEWGHRTLDTRQKGGALVSVMHPTHLVLPFRRSEKVQHPTRHIRQQGGALISAVDPTHTPRFRRPERVQVTRRTHPQDHLLLKLKDSIHPQRQQDQASRVRHLLPRTYMVYLGPIQVRWDTPPLGPLHQGTGDHIRSEVRGPWEEYKWAKLRRGV